MSDPVFKSRSDLDAWLAERGRECNNLKIKHRSMANAQIHIAPILDQCRRVICAHPQFLGQKDNAS
jgi:hypothetical protein